MAVVRNLKSVEDFHEFISEQDGKLRIAKLSAPWCGPCRVLGDTIRNLDSEKIGSTLFAEVDIDTDQTEEIGAECNIRGVPVLLFYKNGNELARTTGAISAADIYKKIEELS